MRRYLKNSDMFFLKNKIYLCKMEVHIQQHVWSSPLKKSITSAYHASDTSSLWLLSARMREQHKEKNREKRDRLEV